jgi:hypothetical protein
VLRLQDAGSAVPSNTVPQFVPERVEVPPPLLAQPVPLAVTLPFAPQPVTRTARVTVTFALEPGTAPAR